MTLEQMMDLAERGARENLRRHPKDQLLPVFIGEDINGKSTVIGAPMGSEIDKQLTLLAIKEKFRELGVKRYVHICEAWVSEHDKRDPPSQDPPSQDPKRREAVVIIATDGMNTFGRFLIMRRDKRGHVVQLTTEEQSGSEIWGRFTRLLDAGEA